MKPQYHANISAKKFGGKPEDYQAIHDFFDSPKSAFCDVRSRAILHNSFGIYLAERVFGITMTNSNGRKVSVRDVAEQHVFDDMGYIPEVGDWIREIPLRSWMDGRTRKPSKIRKVSLTD